MKRIDELVGIINGINYDGVINEYEIKSLQNWKDLNKESDKPAVQEIVQLIEEILEDGIVTEEERMQLLLIVKQYQTSDENTYRSYYVLNGIIEGIISDKVINYDEATSLRQWLNENDYLKGNKVYDRTRTILEEVLEDEIITEEEHDELLHTFEQAFSSFKQHAILEAIKRKIERRENIGLDIIDLSDNEDLVRIIHYDAEKEVKKGLHLYSGSLVSGGGGDSIFLSLVLIALKKYDGAFYTHAQDQYQDVYENNSRQKVDSALRELVNWFRPAGNDEDGRIINYVMMNTLVPENYLPDFFVFMFDIYRLNFGFTLSDTVYDDLAFVYEGLSEKMLEDTDDLELNVTKKTYKLTKGTKNVIRDADSREDIIRLSERVLQIIEESYWDDRDPKIENAYLKHGFDEWQKKLEEKERKRSRSEMNRARWTPAFLFRKGEFFLCPPAHNVHGVDNYYSIAIKVYNGENLVYTEDSPEIYEIIGGFQVRPKEIKLDDPLRELRYVLYEGDRIIYDSRERLYRQFIMFGLNGFEVRNNHPYEGSVYIVHSCENSDLDLVFRTDDFIVSSASDVDEDTVLYLDDTVISFAQEIKPGLNGEIVQNQYLECDGARYPVYRKLDSLSFESEYEIDEIGVMVNGKRTRITELGSEEKHRGNRYYYITNLGIDSPGKYDVSAFHITDGKTIKGTAFSVCVDPELSIETLQLDDREFLVNVRSSLDSDGCYELKLDDLEDFSVSAIVNEQEYKYLIDPGIRAYRIDSGKWKSFDEEMWIGDISSTSQIELRGADYTHISISDKWDNLLDKIDLRKKDIAVIGQIGSLVSFRAEQEYVTIKFYEEKGMVSKSICYNKCMLDLNNTHVINDPTTDKVKVEFVFHGQGKIGYRLANTKEEVLLENKEMDLSKPLVFKRIPPLSMHYLQFYEGPKGFSLAGERELGMVPLFSFQLEDLVGRAALIPKVIFEKYSEVDGILLPQEYGLDETYVRFTRYKGNGFFEGRILRKHNGQFRQLKNAGHVEIEYLGEPSVNMMEAAITFEGDGLLLDFARKTIHMDYLRKDAYDIYSYTINLKGARK